MPGNSPGLPTLFGRRSFELVVADGSQFIPGCHLRLGFTRTVQWYAAGVMSFCFVIVSVNQLTPQIAHIRSNHAAAKLLRTEPNLQNAPVVFFGRENYGAAMTLPKDQVYFYESEKADEVCEFLIEHPNSIIISSKKPMENLRRMLSWNILLDRSESARHLYQSRLNPDGQLIAEQPADTILR